MPVTLVCAGVGAFGRGGGSWLGFGGFERIFLSMGT